MASSGRSVGACHSTDDGRTWQWLGEVPSARRSAQRLPRAAWVEARSGRLVSNSATTVNAGETLQSESSDGGKTWSAPHSIGVWGLPSHLLRLVDGRLLITTATPQWPSWLPGPAERGRRPQLVRGDNPRR